MTTDQATGVLLFNETGSAETIERLENALSLSEAQLFRATEGLQRMNDMIDEKGWSPLFEHGYDGGLTLAQLKAISAQLRELLAANPLLSRASQLRIAYTHGGGVEFESVKADGSPAGKLTARVRALMNRLRNKRYVFGNTAHEELERAALTDGNIWLLGDDGSRDFHRVAMSEITADFRNPDNQEEVWMFRRAWTRNPDAPNEDDHETVVRWYYTDLYEGRRYGSVRTRDGRLETIERGKTILHLAFNQQTNWVYGIPDALPVMAYIRLYREFLANGYIMSKALARIAFRVTAPSLSAAKRAAAEAKKPGSGEVAISGEGNDISALSSAGKGYEFEKGLPLAQMIAAGLEVGVDALLGKKGGDTLDPPARASALMRRRNWDDHYDRIFAYFGEQYGVKSTWQDLPEETIQRRLQAWALANASGLFAPEILQAGYARELDIANPGPVPETYSPPGSGAAGGTGAAGATDGSGQGQSSPAGKADDDHDDSDSDNSARS